MNRAARNYWRSQTIFGGYGSYGAGTKATLKIGRIAGLNYSGWREGERISVDAVERAILGRRMQQIKGNAIGLNRVDTHGRYKGQKEPSASVEMIWTGDGGETRTQFFRNMKKLAQDVAGDLAQRSVLVEWDAPGRRGRVDAASPKSAPAPTDKRFCAWVRGHSGAGRRPSDDCYEKRKRR